MDDFFTRELMMRRFEILAYDVLMHLALYFFTAVIAAVFAVAVVKDHELLYKLVVALIFSTVVFVAMRGDFFGHRFAGHAAYLESEMPQASKVIGKSGLPVQGFEEWKAARTKTWFVVAVDLVGAVVLMWILWQVERALWIQGHCVFAVVTGIATPMAGILGIPLAIYLAPK